jgi:hypothetical protein
VGFLASQTGGVSAPEIKASDEQPSERTRGA